MAVVLMDPTGELEPIVRTLIDRPASLAGYTVALLDITKPRGNVFLDRVKAVRTVEGTRYENVPVFWAHGPREMLVELDAF